MILAPAVEHVDTGELLSKHTWSERGWCRLEQVAANFLTKDAKIVVIESVQKIHIMRPSSRLVDLLGHWADQIWFEMVWRYPQGMGGMILV